jgi:ABC-type bacteriocin/lantibiotic exporter with double-glycine peptidase domain
MEMIKDEEEGDIVLNDLKGNIQFKNVSFSYHGKIRF